MEDDVFYDETQEEKDNNLFSVLLSFYFQFYIRFPQQLKWLTFSSLE